MMFALKLDSIKIVLFHKHEPVLDFAISGIDVSATVMESDDINAGVKLQGLHITDRRCRDALFSNIVSLNEDEAETGVPLIDLSVSKCTANILDLKLSVQPLRVVVSTSLVGVLRDFWGHLDLSVQTLMAPRATASACR